MAAPAEKASFLGSQFGSKQCREQFGTPLSCFPQSRCNSFAFWTPALLHLLLHEQTWCLGLDTYGAVDFLDEFPLFLKMVAHIIA